MKRQIAVGMISLGCLLGGASSALATFCYEPGQCPPTTKKGKICIPRVTSNNFTAVTTTKVVRNGWLASGQSCGTVKMPVLPLPGYTPCGPNGLNAQC